MKRYAATRTIECRTLLCAGRLDVTGCDEDTERQRVSDAGWEPAPPDVNRHMSPQAGRYICRACAERRRGDP